MDFIFVNYKQLLFRGWFLCGFRTFSVFRGFVFFRLLLQPEESICPEGITDTFRPSELEPVEVTEFHSLEKKRKKKNKFSLHK